MYSLIKSFLIFSLLLVPFYKAHAGKATYIYSDPQGTPLAEADAQGNITNSFDYRPYGSLAMGSPSAGIGYTGHVSDADSSLIYMQARYYDPLAGRFLSTDKIGYTFGDVFSTNSYLYVRANPLILTDPSGMAPKPAEDMNICGDPFPCEGDSDPERAARQEIADDQASSCDETCQLYKDYDRNLTSKERLAADTGKQIAKAMSVTVEQGYEFYLGGVVGKAVIGGLISLRVIGEEGLALLRAEPVGSALKDDIYHNAASFVRREAAASGTRFKIVGGDGVTRSLIQLKGEVNGIAGRFEYIVDGAKLTHQRFIPGGAINGIPNTP